MQTQLGNYGHIKYGDQFLADVVYALDNTNGCRYFDDSDFKVEYSSS